MAPRHPIPPFPVLAPHEIAALDARFPDRLPDAKDDTSVEQLALRVMRLRGQRDVIEALIQAAEQEPS